MFSKYLQDEYWYLCKIIRITTSQVLHKRILKTKKSLSERFDSPHATAKYEIWADDWQTGVRATSCGV